MDRDGVMAVVERFRATVTELVELRLDALDVPEPTPEQIGRLNAAYEIWHTWPGRRRAGLYASTRRLQPARDSCSRYFLP